jgi:hypothetical protein
MKSVQGIIGFRIGLRSEEEERRLYHKGQQSNRMQHDQPISQGLVWHQGGYD